MIDNKVVWWIFLICFCFSFILLFLILDIDLLVKLKKMVECVIFVLLNYYYLVYFCVMLFLIIFIVLFVDCCGVFELEVVLNIKFLVFV